MLLVVLARLLLRLAGVAEMVGLVVVVVVAVGRGVVVAALVVVMARGMEDVDEEEWWCWCSRPSLRRGEVGGGV